MDSLFSGNYVNTQPLRKFEPLIRFDSDGNPQPRKPLKVTANLNDQHLPSQPSATPSSTEPKSPGPKKSSTKDNVDKPHEELKRKVTEPPPGVPEPKKKQQKQQSITSFFKKC